MPELPEVETIRQYLRRGKPGSPSVLGKRISAARVLWDRTVAEPSPPDFVERVAGQIISEIGRRGKFMLFELTHDTLLLHLRMSGDLWVETAGDPIAPHHRLLLDFEDGVRLAFNDARKFGRAWLVADPQTVVGNLGPEPLDDRFTAADLYAGLQKRRRQLKPLLMDQTFLAGLGNIYTDEALHRARLHPLTLSHQVTVEQSAQLRESIRQVLLEGIRRNGTSIDWVYRGGDFQRYLQVHRRAGEACKTCGTLVERIVVGQRSTYLCPTCQRAPDGGLSA